MQSQEIQATVLDSEKLQQLNTEVEQELSNILKHSNFSHILEKYGLSLEDGSFKIHYSIEQNSNPENTLPVIPFRNRMLLDCKLNGQSIPC